MEIYLEKEKRTIEFERIPINFKKNNLDSLFFIKNNTTLSETLKNKRYSPLKDILGDISKEDMNTPIGLFLKKLKESNDDRYLKFLNNYGDLTFCKFMIEKSLSDNGIYAWVLDNEIKYVGRCTNNYRKRINQGYGNISPKNCFKDGQATNCHLNSEINKVSDRIQLYFHKMTGSSIEDIKLLEKNILKEKDYEWNIQKR